MKFFPLALTAAALALLGAGCSSSVALYQPPSIEIFNQKLTEAEIVASIETGAGAQGWEITEKGSAYMLLTNLPDASAKYNEGNRVNPKPRYATIRVSYDSKMIKLEYVSSERLRYEHVTEGKQAVHRLFNQYLMGLRQAIDHQVKVRVNNLDV